MKRKSVAYLLIFYIHANKYQMNLVLRLVSVCIKFPEKCNQNVIVTIKKRSDFWSNLLILSVGMTGFEPATSASRTQRSTKLSHIPLRIPSLLSNGEGTGGCPTRIRTQTNRVRVCRATFTQSGNSNMNYYNGSGEKVKTYRKKTAFIFYFWRKVPLIARAARRTIHIANAKPMKERNKPCLTRKPRTH